MQTNLIFYPNTWFITLSSLQTKDLQNYRNLQLYIYFNSK